MNSHRKEDVSEQEKIAHLSMIQQVINRMASNSAATKTWSLTLSAALVAVAISFDTLFIFGLAISVPLVGFWYLDAYYLRLERSFRKLYVSAANDTPQVGAFSLDSTPYMPGVPSILRTMASASVGPFYLTLIIATTVVAAIASLAPR